jgi:hypothetical protein
MELIARHIFGTGMMDPGSRFAWPGRRQRVWLAPRHTPRRGRACPDHPRLVEPQLKTWVLATSASTTAEGAIGASESVMAESTVIACARRLRARLHFVTLRVVVGLVPTIHVFLASIPVKTWIPGTRPGTTTESVVAASESTTAERAVRASKSMTAESAVIPART